MINTSNNDDKGLSHISSEFVLHLFNSCLFRIYSALFTMISVIIMENTSSAFVFHPTQVLSFTHPVSFHSAETFESLLGCLKMDDEKVAEAALQIFKNTGSKMEESFPHIKSYVSLPD